MKKRKITLTIIICLIGCMVLGISAAATGTGRRANLKSAGSIDVQIDNQEIYISSSDFRYLADEIDTLENTYKMNIVDALNSIGTYFKADGTAVYDSGLNEVNTTEEKIAIKFNRLREAISSSQSITSLSQTQAEDKEGNLLFYIDEAARDQENLLKTTIVDTGFPVYYRPATEENLTAGAAAWVDGTLIKGNGVDEAAALEQNASALGYKRVIDLGVGTTFDVTQYYDDYTNLTEENFYIRPDKTISGSNWNGTASIGNNVGSYGVKSLSARIKLSYDPDTGILTASLTASASGGANSTLLSVVKTVDVAVFLIV